MDDAKLREKIKAFIDASGLTLQAISDKAGFGSGHLSKILSGADGRTVRLPHLMKIAEALGKPLSAFFEGEPFRVPVVGGINAFGGPPSTAADAQEAEEYFEPFTETDDMESCYTVTIADRSMTPFYKPGTTLMVRRHSSDQIENEDVVIYRGGETMQVRSILLTPESIILKAFNPSVEVQVLPRTHLQLCDLVFQAIRPLRPH
jgi:transcriptional regulator with XRE-family HTH domain